MRDPAGRFNKIRAAGGMRTNSFSRGAADRRPAVSSIRPVLPQLLQHLIVLHLLGPRTRRRPRVGVRLHWVRAPRQQELHEMDAPPAASPPERRALEQIVADVESCAGV